MTYTIRGVRQCMTCTNHQDIDTILTTLEGIKTILKAKCPKCGMIDSYFQIFEFDTL